MLALEVLIERSTRDPRRDGGALMTGRSTQDPRREAGEDGVKDGLRVATDMTLKAEAGGLLLRARHLREVTKPTLKECLDGVGASCPVLTDLRCSK